MSGAGLLAVRENPELCWKHSKFQVAKDKQVSVLAYLCVVGLESIRK